MGAQCHRDRRCELHCSASPSNHGNPKWRVKCDKTQYLTNYFSFGMVLPCINAWMSRGFLIEMSWSSYWLSLPALLHGDSSLIPGGTFEQTWARSENGSLQWQYISSLKIKEYLRAVPAAQNRWRFKLDFKMQVASQNLVDRR